MSLTLARELERDKDHTICSSIPVRFKPPCSREILRLSHREDKACGIPRSLASLSEGEGPLHSLITPFQVKIPNLWR